MSKQEETLERTYTIPLTRAWITARHKRTKRAVKVLREFAEKHMKSSEIKIETELNERLWKRGITKPPRRITVRMEKDEDGLVTISLPKVEKPAEVEEEEVALEPVKKQESEAPAPAEVGEKVQKKAPKKRASEKKPRRKVVASKKKKAGTKG